jgi:uncharacterized membrane protein YeiH
MNGLQWLDVAAIFVIALSGLIAGVRKEMDLVGLFTVAFVSAFGGGTLRDLLLDNRPFVWVKHDEYIWLILFLTLIAPPLIKLLRYRVAQWLMQVTDALALGLFAASGALLALNAAMPLTVVVLLGVVTGVFGGVLRDIFCNEIPAVFRDHQPYAICAFIGCWVLVALHTLQLPSWLVLTMGIATTTSLRLLGVIFGWRIPNWGRSGESAGG